MILMMAVQQRWTGIIGNEIDLDAAIAGHVDRVLHYARGRLVADLGQLERVAVQVDRNDAPRAALPDRSVPDRWRAR